MEYIIDEIRTDLKQSIDTNTQKTSQRFFKEKIKYYGVRVPILKEIGIKYFKLIECKSKPEILDLCEKLWQSGFIEESLIACNWSYYIHKKYEPEDFQIFQKWIHDYVNNWASCDTLCNHTIGKFLEMYPLFVESLKELAVSNNRWMRRAASVSLIVPARKGKFLNEILEIVDIMLLDKDDLVQKGNGWLLKTASETNQHAIFNYVIRCQSIMPRTTLRYAIEKMPKEWRMKAMEK